MAARNDVFIELSALVHASYANGHIFRIARSARAEIAVNSDTHFAHNMLTPRKVGSVIIGAGGETFDIHRATVATPAILLRRALRALAVAS
jgi:histidinol phosphatase-like PHP family hydrolase